MTLTAQQDDRLFIVDLRFYRGPSVLLWQTGKRDDLVFYVWSFRDRLAIYFHCNKSQKDHPILRFLNSYFLALLTLLTLLMLLTLLTLLV